MDLFDYQREAISRMKNGCILAGGVGSGKSITSIAYYVEQYGGRLNPWKPMEQGAPNLYIITTAKKRDSREWNKDMLPFLLSEDEKISKQPVKVVIDSWNNLHKYIIVSDAFFIFDEQRVVGKGEWVKSFLKIAKKNKWILLSATPGDTWMDYIPVFIANGFFANRSEFYREHVVWNPYVKFQQVDRFVGVRRLERLRDNILVSMNYGSKAKRVKNEVYVEYSKLMYQQIIRTRQNPDTGEPFLNASGLCQALRKCVNSDISRQKAVVDILTEKHKAIIFYNYDYELEILKNLDYPEGTIVSECNGHKHESIPQCDTWVYLVQYNAGSEGWNSTQTDTIIFYSQNYSYKMMEQASGRIDRLNTPYENLYYYILKTHSGIDVAISRTLSEKKKFNESRFGLKLAPDLKTTA